MSQSQPCTTTVAIAHNGHGLVTLTVGVRIVAEFFGERKMPYLRRPFREYSFASALGTRSGSRKVTGEHVVAFATAYQTGVYFEAVLNEPDIRLKTAGDPHDFVRGAKMQSQTVLNLECSFAGVQRYYPNLRTIRARQLQYEFIIINKKSLFGQWRVC